MALRTHKINSTIPSTGIFNEPVSAVEFIAMLRDVTAKHPDRIRRNDLNMAVNIFEKFLPPKALNPDETLMNDFQEFLSKKYHDRKLSYYRKFTYHVRSVVNSLPNIQRTLITPRALKSITRFNNYTPETKALFEEFLRDGRRINTDNDSCKLTTYRLAETTRNSCVANARTFLTAIDKNDFLTITEDDIEDLIAVYDERSDNRDRVNHLLADLDPLFRYMCAKGLIKKNLVEDIEKPNNINNDYIDQNGINKLFDFSKLAWDNFIDLRDRMITVCLYYDFALRRNEAPRLDVSDVSFNKFLDITLRPEVQEKAQNRKEPARTLVFNNFFKQSRILMEAYLEKRKKDGLTSNALLVTENDVRLGSSGCEDAVLKQCAKLGVKTVYGKEPRPHRLKHSMATNNIRPLGAKIEWRQIQKRMRHKSIVTTEQVYITNNPLIDKEEHAKWAEEQYGREEHSEPIHLVASNNNDVYLPEADALKMLNSYEIKIFSLRKYAEEKQAFKSNGSGNLYSKTLIENLATNYYTKDEAMRLTGYKPSGFFYWLKSNAVEQIVIGKVSLISRQDVMNKIRRVEK